MRLGHFELFRPVCPVCARQDRGLQPLVLAERRAGTADEIQAGMLHCPEPSCRHEYPILDGIPLIVPDLRRLLTEQGVGILLRDDLDPLLESLVGDAIGPDSWFDATRQVLSTYGWDGWADLDPAEESPGAGPVPGAARRCLDRLLALAGLSTWAAPPGAPASTSPPAIRTPWSSGSTSIWRSSAWPAAPAPARSRIRAAGSASSMTGGSFRSRRTGPGGSISGPATRWHCPSPRPWRRWQWRST
jgi:uncharacterized protein YbaR (Trm112 family)